MPTNTEEHNVVATDEKKDHRTSSFREKESDPGFLVAKGKFNSQIEKQGPQQGETPDLFQRRVYDDQRALERAHVKNLASAIFMAMSNCGYANIRAVGRNATYNAIKAIAIAKSYCAPKGIELCWDVSFDEGNLGALRNKNHVSSVTAMLFSLKGYREWVEEGESEGEEVK
jgi:stage V sporulation protein SpoVS